MYLLKNIPGDTAPEWNAQLAHQIYESIRKCDTDILNIAINLGFKGNNIKKMKEHVFINNYYLDRYGPKEAKYKRFDFTF